MRGFFSRLACALLLVALPCAAWAGGAVKAAMLINLGTGKVLYEQNADRQLAPASLTKLMTMYLTFDAIRSGRLNLSEKVAISRQAAKIGGSVMRLNAGEKAPVTRLLAGTAVASGNDAATALAERVGGNTANFVRMMNSKARKLGMSRTVFKNPTGLPAAGQKITARDLGRLCQSYLAKRPEAARFHAMSNFLHKGLALRNTNPLLGKIPGVNGLKTGWTVASGYNLIITAKKGKTRLLAIILGAPDKKTRDSVAIRLVEAGYKFPDSPARARQYISRGLYFPHGQMAGKF